MEFIKESKRAFRRIFDDVKTTIGLSLITAIVFFSVLVAVYLFIKAENYEVGVVLYLIGLFTAIYTKGYGIENMHNLQKHKRLPKVTKDVDKKFLWGVVATAISLVYSLVAVIPGEIITIAVNKEIGSVVTIILSVIIMFPSSAALIEYSKKMKFSDAFKKEIFEKAYRAKFVGYLIGGVLIGYLIYLGLWITVAGGIILGAIGTLYIQHMAVTGYTEKKIRNRTKKKRK